MVQPSILMCWSFVQILMFCDLGENVTTGFSTLGDSIYFCDWYHFPLEFQRTLPTLLMVAEKSVELRGFGNIPCTRKAFRKVSFLFISKQCPTICGYLGNLLMILLAFQALKAGFSYFMVLRTIEKNWSQYLNFTYPSTNMHSKVGSFKICLQFHFTLCMCTLILFHIRAIRLNKIMSRIMFEMKLFHICEYLKAIFYTICVSSGTYFPFIFHLLLSQ